MPAPLLLALGAALTLLSLTALGRILPRRPDRAGREIPTAGPLFLPIILLTLVSGALGLVHMDRSGVVFLFYAAVAGLVGFVDDLWGGAGSRGFRGHLGAFARGRVTTGALKLVVLGGGALVLGVVVADGVGRVVWAAVLMAGSANLANLFDVRPGRAIKFVGVLFTAALPFVPSWGALVAVWAVVGGALGLFPFDLRGRIMLGDSGAAVVGATLGYAVIQGGPGPAWWFYLVVILGSTALAEVSSISKVVERVGFLRRLDLWGRG